MEILNGCKREVMMILWDAEKPLTRNEIISRGFLYSESHTRKIIESLMNCGLIKPVSSPFTIMNLELIPTLSKEEYIKQLINDFGIDTEKLIEDLRKKNESI